MYQIVEFTKEVVNLEMLDNYKRRQVVTSHYFVDNGVKSIRPISFTDDWSKDVRRDIVKNFFLSDSYYSGGIIVEGEVIAFYVLEVTPMENSDYLELKHLQVSAEYRNQGIGKLIFSDIIKKAMSLSAKKIYISAHSALETQEFYNRLGCVDAKWISKKAVEAEPYDIMLEYDLYDNYPSDLKMSELLNYSKTLHQKYADKWEPMEPEHARDSILYMIEEVGEVIAVIKKKSIDEIMNDKAVRNHLVEELTDVLMYYTDALNRFKIDAKELSEAYIKKYNKNMNRNYTKDHQNFIISKKEL